MNQLLDQNLKLHCSRVAHLNTKPKKYDKDKNKGKKKQILTQYITENFI